MINLSTKNILMFAFCLYISSLFCVAVTPINSSVSVRGYELLLTGWVQTMLAFYGMTESLLRFEIGSFISYFLLALPWLANLFFALSFYLMITSFGKKLCKQSIIYGVVCAFVFMLKPEASIGGDVSFTVVELNVGAYLWFFTSLVLCLAYYVKSFSRQ